MTASVPPVWLGSLRSRADPPSDGFTLPRCAAAGVLLAAAAGVAGPGPAAGAPLVPGVPLAAAGGVPVAPAPGVAALTAAGVPDGAAPGVPDGRGAMLPGLAADTGVDAASPTGDGVKEAALGLSSTLPNASSASASCCCFLSREAA